jgi:hypothetical protein
MKRFARAAGASLAWGLVAPSLAACPSPTAIVDAGQWLSSPANPNNPRSCVALVQNLDPTIGSSAGWQAGSPVSCSTPIGTPVATFLYGSPGNLTYGPSYAPGGVTGAGMTHTGIFNGCDAAGDMTLLNQWAQSNGAPQISAYAPGECGNEHCMGSYYAIKSGSPVYGPDAACNNPAATPACPPGPGANPATGAPVASDATQPSASTADINLPASSG